jgi:hypothetical protein
MPAREGRLSRLPGLHPRLSLSHLLGSLTSGGGSIEIPRPDGVMLVLRHPNGRSGNEAERSLRQGNAALASGMKTFATRQ